VRDQSHLRALAFYLPQFHPIPENDVWWGRGFTEWANVVRARPLFHGHHQPHLPADLGFYDLRLVDTRVAQADLAREAGLHGFCYYHYWFEGRRLLHRPVDDLLSSGEPGFPFALCWANENWTRVWTGGDREVLMPQRYSDEDDLAHIRWLATAFADRRYIRVDDRPLFLVYRPSSLPHAARTTDRWRAEAQRLGVGELYLCAVHSNTTVRRDPALDGFDAAVDFQPDFGDLGPRVGQHLIRRVVRRFLSPDSPYRLHSVHRYDTFVERQLDATPPPFKKYPCVSPGFDNSSRRTKGGAAILTGSTPELYERWLRAVVGGFEPYSPDENFVFVNAWNEWAEGNHLEPCQRWGHAYLDAQRRATHSESHGSG
jgi:lipopolysaccharide biosynthesis protein